MCVLCPVLQCVCLGIFVTERKRERCLISLSKMCCVAGGQCGRTGETGQDDDRDGRH